MKTLKCRKCGFVSEDREIICSKVQGGCGYKHNFFEFAFYLNPNFGILLVVAVLFAISAFYL